MFDGMDIAKIKTEEMDDIQHFCNTIRDYGHIYHYPKERLDAPFKKIMEGIEEVNKLMTDSFEM
jgi:hypothetical protein